MYVDVLVLRNRDTNGDGTLEQRLWVAQDANYNVTALFDNAGNVVERYAYDPFGQVTVLDAGWNVLAASAFAWVYLHQGGRFDATSGLYHFRHRDYSPTLGRWTSLDPIRYLAGDLNLYRAVGNGPTNRLDPSGMDWLDWVQGGLDVIGVFDPTPLSDGVNALISAGRGDWTGAGLSAISMIPYAGDVIGKGGKGVRYGKKTVDAIEAAKAGKAATEVAQQGLKHADDCTAKYSATLGKATSTDYKATFFKAHPELEGKVVVHHAIEQQVLKRYPGVITEAELHSLENLRGIPKEVNPDVHLSKIRKEWNKFYEQFDSTGTVPTRQQLLDKATEIDKKYGTQFRPPVGG